MDEIKIKALIHLLDDPNQEIFGTVEEALLQAPIDAVPLLEKAFGDSEDELIQERLGNIIHQIQLSEIHRELQNWIRTGSQELLYGVYLVCKYQYPELSFTLLNEKVNAIRRDIWLELHDHLTSLEKIRIINHVLFDLHGFSRNNSNFIAPGNNYLNEVLETKKGNPISLSIIYSVLCQRLGMPVYGVNLPKNFILAFMDDSYASEMVDSYTRVLFYINPINKGTVLGRKEIDFFLKQQQIEPQHTYFMPCSHTDIVKRLINNLIYAYDALDLQQKKIELKELLKIVDSTY